MKKENSWEYQVNQANEKLIPSSNFIQNVGLQSWRRFGHLNRPNSTASKGLATYTRENDLTKLIFEHFGRGPL